MNEQNCTKIVLAIVAMVGVVMIAAASAFSATHPQKFHEPEPTRTCAYTSG